MVLQSPDYFQLNCNCDSLFPGGLVIGPIIRTMDMLRMMNHGIQWVVFSVLISGVYNFCVWMMRNHWFCPFLYQLSEKIYRSLDTATRTLRFTLPFPMLAYPLYLVSLLPFVNWIYVWSSRFEFIMVYDIWSWFQLQWGRSPGKTGSHFDPNSDLFIPNERKDVITSTVCWSAMAALLVCLSFVMGPVQMLKLYGIPYWVSAVS